GRAGRPWLTRPGKGVRPGAVPAPPATVPWIVPGPGRPKAGMKPLLRPAPPCSEPPMATLARLPLAIMFPEAGLAPPTTSPFTTNGPTFPSAPIDPAATLPPTKTLPIVAPTPPTTLMFASAMSDLTLKAPSLPTKVRVRARPGAGVVGPQRPIEGTVSDARPGVVAVTSPASI